MGRPSKAFGELSDRSKRRKTEQLRASFDSSELAFATQMSLRASGSSTAASVLQDITTRSPERAQKYKAAFKSVSATPRSEISGSVALSDIVEGNLTRHAYRLFTKRLKEHHVRVYPSYDKVMKAKLLCYPKDKVTTETCAEVPLQALLDHTCARILTVQTDVVRTLSSEVVKHLELIVKYGFDGSSGQSEYKQKFSDQQMSDTSILLTSLVPLLLTAENKETKEKLVIWKNPKPSSSRYCRPIRLQFSRETLTTTLDEQNYMNQQITSLVPFTVEHNGQEIVVNYKLVFTMIDGKVRNSITMTKSTLRCYICDATIKQFNNLELVLSLPIKESNLAYGLASLHAWIHFFEYFLHIGYKLTTAKWQARKEQDKAEVAARKKIIQNAFKNKMGLLVDFPKSGGFGSSNDGNTARRFFANSEESSRILGVDHNVIHRAHVILQVISSGFDVNVAMFKEFSLDTAKMLITMYPWYCMPTSIHELLIHGPLIIEWAPLPIGQLSEEAQEARNKDIKKYRDGFSRKCSRQKNMEDIFNWLLVSSDPLITSLRTQPPKPSKSLSIEAIQLLLPSECYASATNFVSSELQDISDSEESSASENSYVHVDSE